jgi:alginate O-acetyltransferase complex protein AlgI
VVLLCGGLFLKVGLADSLAPFVDGVFAGPAAASSADAALAAVGFGVQIFCDFAGYSTMAVGSAHLFGITVPRNFRLPYLACSLRDFWRRWHITLSSFLRDYLYRPLGGNRRGAARLHLNLLIVMVLGGLWHGAAYTFVVWGLIHGVWLVLERVLVGDATIERGAATRVARSLAGWSITMTVVFVAWVFFRAETVTQAVTLLRALGGGAWVLRPEHHPVLVLLALFVPAHLALERLHDVERPGAAHLVLAAWTLIAALILGAGDSREFIYFQF